MRYFQIIRIVLLIALIFAGGVVTGRLTAPRPPIMVKNVGGKYSTPDTVLERLTKQLSLDAKQQEQFRAILEEVAQEMALLTPASNERLEVFKRAVPRQRALLRPDQYPNFDRMVQETERRFERAIRRKPK